MQVEDFYGKTLGIKAPWEISGGNVRTIENVIAEIGCDMTRLPTAGHLSSWAGICPGNESFAGQVKRRSDTRGNRGCAGR